MLVGISTSSFPSSESKCNCIHFYQSVNFLQSFNMATKAVCVMRGDVVNGVVKFTQEGDGPVTVEGEIKGLKPGKRIEVMCSISSDKCRTTRISCPRIRRQYKWMCERWRTF